MSTTTYLAGTNVGGDYYYYEYYWRMKTDCC